MQDDKKVQHYVNQLNKSKVNKNHPWDSVNGFFAAPQVGFENDKSSILLDSGITCKLFVNLETGELKFVHYQRFLK
jgi:hypothetical protein